MANRQKIKKLKDSLPPEKVKSVYGRDDLGLKPNGKRWSPLTTYDPEYCDVLVEMMAKGCTYVEVAAALKTSIRTFVGWCEQFPEFKEAYEMGEDLAQAWYQRTAREHLVIITEPNGPKVSFDTRQWIHVLKSRYKQYDSLQPNETKEMIADGFGELMKQYTEDLRSKSEC